MSVDAIATKMEKAGIDKTKIEEWKKKHSSQSADQVLASKVNAKEQLYNKYDKMKKMGMPDNTIRNKMKMDGFKENEIESYLNQTHKALQKQQNEKFKKYDRMKKMKMPENTIRNKMKLDGIPKDEIEKYWNPNAGKEEEDEEKEKKPNPALAKYERMKKMGMPSHAIANKMRLDGIEKSLIHRFEHPNEDDEDEESESDEDEDPNEANAINLNIPALAKYHRMTKMGMPKHAIVNKMKLDGIDSSIIDAFENPEKAKEK
eukprot:80988_1